MCYDISFKVQIAEINDYFPGIRWEEQMDLRFEGSAHIVAHGFPLHPILYRNREDGILQGRLMEWGVIPFYVKDELLFARQRAGMLNARGERILGDPKSYWYKIRNRRCLIPVTGIFEHREVPGLKNKIPYWVWMKDQPVFFIPGLYSVAELPDRQTGEILKRWTFTLITTRANPLMREIHNSGDHKGRMPLFLPLDLSRAWLEEPSSGQETWQHLLEYEMPVSALSYRTVWTLRTTKHSPDHQGKTDFYAWKDVPDLGVYC